MESTERFVKRYSQTEGTSDLFEIWVDRDTGVQYLFHRNGLAAGLTPLIDSDGKPVLSKEA